MGTANKAISARMPICCGFSLMILVQLRAKNSAFINKKGMKVIPSLLKNIVIDLKPSLSQKGIARHLMLPCSLYPQQ